jgi:hypothetical protein
MSRGLFIAQSGEDLSKTPLQFDSDNAKVLVNLRADPPHLDEKTLRTATNFVSVAAGSQQETLFSINHGLGYTPEVLVYFYVVSYGGSLTHDNAARYSNKNTLLSGTNGSVADSIYASVNSTSLDIVHELADFFGVGYTSDAASWVVKVKYYIISRDSKVSTYTTKGY